MGYHRKQWSNRHLPIFRSRNNGPNEALEYVQAYIDNLLVIPRWTLEDHLAKLKVLKRMHDAGLKKPLLSHVSVLTNLISRLMLTRRCKPKIKVQAILVLVRIPSIYIELPTPADQESRLVPKHSDRQKPLPPPKQQIVARYRWRRSCHGPSWCPCSLSRSLCHGRHLRKK